MARPQPRTKHSPPVDLEPAVRASLDKLDAMLALPPITGPKPWTDELERAAVARVCAASPPILALSSLGISRVSATDWLSDDPPRAYESACRALSGRLKSAWDWCETDLLERIRTASLDPKHWTAAAWILERSRGYVVRQATDTGPSIVVNIGNLTVNQADKRAGLPPATFADEPVIEAELSLSAIPCQSVDPT